VGRLAGLDGPQLSILAGHLTLTRTRTRCHRQLPTALAGCYGIIRAGTITATTSTGEPITLTAGTTTSSTTAPAAPPSSTPPPPPSACPPATGPQAPGTPAPASA
jgi:hypothetical protein